MDRVQGARQVGRALHKLLRGCLAKWPGLKLPAKAILRGEKPDELDDKLVDKVRAAVLTVLGAPEKMWHRQRTAPAQTPLRAEVMEAWGRATSDPDATTLASWLDKGAPLGISEPIVSNGVFPEVNPSGTIPHATLDHRTLEGWKNYPSAEEEAETLDELLCDYVEPGFCTVVSSAKEAREKLGGEPVLNKLGVLVKEKTDAHGNKVRKACEPCLPSGGEDYPAQAPRRCGVPPGML